MTDEERDEIDEMESFIMEKLGPVAALKAVIELLDYGTRQDVFDEIVRIYELEI